MTSSDCALACAYEPNCTAWFHDPSGRACSVDKARAEARPDGSAATGVGASVSIDIFGTQAGAGSVLLAAPRRTKDPNTVPPKERFTANRTRRLGRAAGCHAAASSTAAASATAAAAVYASVS